MSTTPREQSTDALALIRNLLEQERVSEARSVLHDALAAHPKDEELLRLWSLLAPPRVRRRRLLDADRTKDFRWLAENGAKHHGCWVAIHEGRLLAEATSLDALLERVHALTLTSAPLIHFVD